MKLAVVIELASTKLHTPVATTLVRVPDMETLIARGDSVQLSGSTCDSVLIASFGHDPESINPNAAFYALGEGLAAGTDYWLRADPVCLAPTTTHLTLSELPEDALTAIEAHALAATLNTHLAVNDLVLLTPHPLRWYLRLTVAPDLNTLSPAACAGTLQESHLPSGRDGPEWKRTITEAQMLLHEHPINVAREAEGKAPANAIWPWGGGRLPAPGRRPSYSSVWSDDLLTRGLARSAGITAHALPTDVQTVLANETAEGDALVVIRIAPADHASGIAQVEAHWASPLRVAIERGQLSELSLLVFGAGAAIARCVRRAHLRRWWRRKRALSVHG